MQKYKQQSKNNNPESRKMISFIDIQADNVVGIRLDGKISERDFDAITSLLKEKMLNHQKLRIYAEIESFGGATAETYLKDLKFGIENWDRFKKEAVVTKKEWIKKVVSISDNIFPGIEVKAFSFDEKDKAQKWVQE